MDGAFPVSAALTKRCVLVEAGWFSSPEVVELLADRLPPPQTPLLPDKSTFSWSSRARSHAFIMVGCLLGTEQKKIQRISPSRKSQSSDRER